MKSGSASLHLRSLGTLGTYGAGHRDTVSVWAWGSREGNTEPQGGRTWAQHRGLHIGSGSGLPSVPQAPGLRALPAPRTPEVLPLLCPQRLLGPGAIAGSCVAAAPRLPDCAAGTGCSLGRTRALCVRFMHRRCGFLLPSLRALGSPRFLNMWATGSLPGH